MPVVVEDSAQLVDGLECGICTTASADLHAVEFNLSMNSPSSAAGSLPPMMMSVMLLAFLLRRGRMYPDA